MSETTPQTNLPRAFWIAGGILLGLFVLLLVGGIGVGVGISIGANREAARRDALADAKAKEPALPSTPEVKAADKDKDAPKVNEPAPKLAAQKEPAAPVFDREKLLGKWEPFSVKPSRFNRVVWEFKADGTGVIPVFLIGDEMQWFMKGDICTMDMQGGTRVLCRPQFEGDDKLLLMLVPASPSPIFATPLVLMRVTKEREDEMRKGADELRKP